MPTEPVAGYRAPAEHIQKLNELQQKNAQDVMEAALASGPLSQEMIQGAVENMDWSKIMENSKEEIEKKQARTIPLDDFDKAIIENVILKEQNLELVKENGSLKLNLEKNGLQNLLVAKYKINTQEYTMVIDAQQGHITLEPRNANSV